MAHLILNRIRTPDGTILTSYHRHDYKTHQDTNGQIYMVDGGLDYMRRNENLGATELSVYSDAGQGTVRCSFHWGTRGKDGKSPLTYKPVAALTTNHIQAILDTQTHISKWVRDIFQLELAFRSTSV